MHSNGLRRPRHRAKCSSHGQCICQGLPHNGRRSEAAKLDSCPLKESECKTAALLAPAALSADPAKASSLRPLLGLPALKLVETTKIPPALLPNAILVLVDPGAHGNLAGLFSCIHHSNLTQSRSRRSSKAEWQALYKGAPDSIALRMSARAITMWFEL